jgi:hypothetical protein
MSGALYRMFDSDGALLYIGASMRLPDRMYQHSLDKPWWREVNTIRVEHFDSRDEAFAAEALAITAENPKHNIVRVPSALTYDVKQRRRQNREAREAEQAAHAEDLRRRGVYEWHFHCPNCSRYGTAEVVRGEPKENAECDFCGARAGSAGVIA